MSFPREPDSEPIPGYRLIEPLGSGGFGEVWKCEAPGGLFKAIKFVYGNLNSLDMEGARAEQELHALQRVKDIRHPFVLSMDRIENVDGELLIVMELADKSLHDAFVESQSAGLVGIPRETLLAYLRDAAEALDHMNEKHNLQHLDIKPRNLFLISDRVKVADFGLVKHLERTGNSGVLAGVTPLYAPPETFGGKIASTSDQYSLAIVYQELLTGQRPFNGKNPRQLAQMHLQDQPELRSLPEAERPAVARALSKDPARRFPNCLAFIRSLYLARSVARSAPVIGEPPAGKGQRPRSMADTMEDLLLEQAAGADDDGWKPLPEPEPEPSPAEVSQLGITMAQPQTGALRPTLVIGLGSLGRRALMELRCRFLDRFGELDKLPLFRFLYVDCDPDAVKAATRTSEGQRGDVTFQPNEVYHLPLQPVGHYRRRQLEQLQEWLPREKLYALPRSLKTQGGRALGRLAFTDNYLRLQTRLRREVQQVMHPDAIYQAVSQTGLALRDNVPRIYVIAAASGGGSGFLVDLGYVLRRLLSNCRIPEAPLTAMLLCGAPDDPATPKAELANVYATLTEMNHFSDPAISFSAQYGTDGPRIKEQGPPFDCAYLVTLANRSPEARQESIANLGAYLFHEMTTPLGLRLDQARGQGKAAGAFYLEPGSTPFRSLGTYAVWFPRGLLLRLAARSACVRLLEEWGSVRDSGGTFDADSGDHRRFALVPSEAPLAQSPEIEAACAKALADPGLRPEALAGRIEELAGAALDGPPGEALARTLSALEEQATQFVAQDDPGNWARQALARVREWLGSGLSAHQTRDTGEWRKSRLSRALETAIDQAAAEWDDRLMQAAARLMETPGARVVAAEAAMTAFAAFCQEQAGAAGDRLKAHVNRVQQAQHQLQNALDACLNGAGGFSFFGGRTRRLLRVFMDHLAAFSRQCLAEDLAASVQHFFTVLGGRLQERLRDLAFCRQRLRHVQEALQNPELPFDELAPPSVLAESGPSGPSPMPSAESFWEALRQSATTRVVLPEGERDLERAAARFLARLTPDQWTALDQALQDRVLGPGGGLHQLCLGSKDLTRCLAGPLLDQAAICLGEHLPITDVAQVLLDDAERRVAHDRGETTADLLGHQAREYFLNAAPVVGAAPPVKVRAARGRPEPEPEPDVPEGQAAFLLIPASEAGKTYGEEARRVLPPLQLVRVPGQSALLFCREQGNLRMEDLERLLGPCRRAYEETAVTPLASPHARYDIVDWIPLAP
jgi:serine/threonine protein kinase